MMGLHETLAIVCIFGFHIARIRFILVLFEAENGNAATAANREDER
jgi:hypothetical protein